MTDRSLLIEQVQRAVEQRPGTRPRTGDDGERWLDLRCPLHDDAHRSASFSLDRGTFVCRVCSPGSSIRLERVAASLAIPAPDLQANGRGRPATMREPEIEAWRVSFNYYWPNGELSHHHWRIQFANIDHKTGKPKKRYLHQAPGGEWVRPSIFYPIYGDLGCPQGAHVILTEGEPATDAINVCQLQISGIPIVAWTSGSTADLIQAREILLRRLADVQASSVTLWPDADEPGVKAMRELRKYLAEHHTSSALVKPEDYQLANKDDAVEFIARGGNLALLMTSLHRPASGPKPVDVADRLTVLQEGVLWPGAQVLAKIDQVNASALWQQIAGQMPTDRQAKELTNVLKAKQALDPTPSYWRIYTVPGCAIWKPAPADDCFQLTKDGIDVVAGSPAGVLLAPGASVVPSAVDLNADGFGMYQELCSFFGLSNLEQHMILAWWICCLTGRETPILLMRGQAGTGKSTLASFVLGLVEPTLREINLGSQRSWTDERQLIQTLRQVPAVLIDNVSAISGAMEDTLSQLVTGYNASVMWKYSNDVEQVRMRRGIILTTTNYDVYKGDLASRIIVCQPSVPGGWLDRDRINARFMPMLPAIRGWVFKQVCRCYLPHKPDLSFRVASIGDVLSALGLDAPTLAAQESERKARTLNVNDPWLESIVAIWDRQNNGGEFMLSHGQIIQEMRDMGIPFELLPPNGSPKFSRWVEEKQMLLRDHGFWLERYRDEKVRGFWFRRVK